MVMGAMSKAQILLPLVVAGFPLANSPYPKSVRGVPNSKQCLNGPCAPGNDFCGEPFPNAPRFHLMDQHGCGENDPNGPVFDPVHGVFHHFYQIHLAYGKGHGPDYGHFVSRDFVHWADIRTAIWNGLDISTDPPTVTKYDNEAIFTGSAAIVDGAGPNGAPGMIQIYPGLCNKDDWGKCETGTLLAQAVPANYESDALLVNWTKPSYNPIIENTERDPSSPWKIEATGEWRLRTYDSKVYGAASDADMIAGKWYEIGVSEDFRTCECPSLYPLPSPTPGFEDVYKFYESKGTLPTHVHKTSCGGDWWQLGTYTSAAKKKLGSFKATPGWEDLFEQKEIEKGRFYASKDNEYPTLDGGKRRINWGWAMVHPDSTQTLPREITFNAAARTLEQAPIEELKALRGNPVAQKQLEIPANGVVDLGVKPSVGLQSEIVATFKLPSHPATFGVKMGNISYPDMPVSTMMKGVDLPGGDYNSTHHPGRFGAKGCQKLCAEDKRCQAWTWVIRGRPKGSGYCFRKNFVPCPAEKSSCTSGAKVNTTLKTCHKIDCTVEYPGPSPHAEFVNATVKCGNTEDVLRLLPGENEVEIRVFTDWTMIEAYFQKGRVAMTLDYDLTKGSRFALVADQTISANATVYPLKNIWVSADEVRNAPRIYK